MLYFDLCVPYRQGVHHVPASCLIDSELITQPQIPPSSSASHEPSLLQKLEVAKLIAKQGCAMEFFPETSSTFRGQLEEGCQCLVPRNGPA